MFNRAGLQESQGNQALLIQEKGRLQDRSRLLGAAPSFVQFLAADQAGRHPAQAECQASQAQQSHDNVYDWDMLVVLKGRHGLRTQ